MADELLSLEANLKQLITGELDKINTTLKNTDKQAKNSFDKISKEALKSAAAFIGLGGAAMKLKQGMGFVVMTSARYEQSLSRLKAIAQPTQKEFKALEEQARELGRTTVFSASEAAKAFTNLAQLGLNTNQILASSQGVLQLAAAAQIDMSQAAEITASTLAQFKLSASESNRVVDIMAKSFNISALNAQRFQESMKFAGVASGNFGVSVETTTAALAALSKQNIVGTIAGTGMKNVMSQLFQETSKVGKLIGVTANDSRTFTERLKAVRDTGMSAGEMMNTFGLEAGNVAIALVNNVDALEDFDEQLQNADGSAEKMSETMQDNLLGSLTKLKSVVEGFAITLGNAFNPAIRGILKLTTKWISANNTLLKLSLGQTDLQTERVKSTIEEAKKTDDLNKLFELRSEILKKITDEENNSKMIINTVNMSLKRRTKLYTESQDKIVSLRTQTKLLADAMKEMSGGGGGPAVSVSSGGDDGGGTGGTGGSGNAEKEAKKLLDVHKKVWSEISSLDADNAQKAWEFKQAKLKAEGDALNRLKETKIMSEYEGTEQEIKLLQSRHERELAELGTFNEAKEILKKEHELKIKNIEKQAVDERNKLIFDSSLDVTQGLNDGITSIVQRRIQREKEMEIDRVKSSTKSSAEQQKAIEAIEKKAFKKSKRANLLKAIINTALAVTSTIANTPGVVASRAIAGAAVGALGAIQIATIAAQKFARGGIVPGAQTIGDRVPAQLNSGEMVLNRQQQGNLFNAINSGTISQTRTEQEPVQITFQVNGNLDQTAADTIIDRTDQIRQMVQDLRLARENGMLENFDLVGAF